MSLMNRRKVLADSLFHLYLWFIGPFLVGLAGAHFRSRILVELALGAIAVSFGIVGFHELDRGGHESARRISTKCITIWFAITLILIGIFMISIISKPTISKITSLGLFFECSLYPFLALIAMPFPLALYLNRKRDKSDKQPTIANAL